MTKSWVRIALASLLLVGGAQVRADDPPPKTDPTPPAAKSAGGGGRFVIDSTGTPVPDAVLEARRVEAALRIDEELRAKGRAQRAGALPPPPWPDCTYPVIVVTDMRLLETLVREVEAGVISRRAAWDELLRSSIDPKARPERISMPGDPKGGDPDLIGCKE